MTGAGRRGGPVAVRTPFTTPLLVEDRRTLPRLDIVMDKAPLEVGGTVSVGAPVLVGAPVSAGNSVSTGSAAANDAPASTGTATSGSESTSSSTSTSTGNSTGVQCDPERDADCRVQ